MTKTENYQLNQWEPADPIRRTDFNADNAAIDAAIKAVADTAASKASAESVSALSQTVSALSAALGSGGENLRITSGSYVGTGTYGAAAPVTLTAPFYPMVVICGSKEECNSMTWPTVLLRGMDCGHCDASVDLMTVTWNDTSVSYYSATRDIFQNNYNGAHYAYVILGYSQ